MEGRNNIEGVAAHAVEALDEEPARGQAVRCVATVNGCTGGQCTS